MRVAEVDCFNNIASMTALPCTYHLPAMHGAGSLDREDPESIKAIIIFGGSGSLTEPLEWRMQLEKWFDRCLQKNIPVLGFCWGHQWIANYFGGKIGAVPGERLKGFRQIKIEKGRIFEATSGKVAVAHRAMVTEAPKRTNNFATSETIPHEGFEYFDHPIYTFQAHPEATLEYLRNNSFTIDGSEDFTFGNNLVKKFISSITTSNYFFSNGAKDKSGSTIGSAHN
jgi:GMP synthase-like glutamine amidotransferase